MASETSGGGGGSGVIREMLAVFGIGLDTSELDKGENQVEEFIGKLKGIAAGIAGAFAVKELYEFVEGQAHAITGVEHMAAQIGISTEEIQEWQYAAQASGYEADKFTNAMSRLQVAASNPQGAKAFKALGISVKDAAGNTKDANQLFGDVADAIQKTEDPNKRAAIATRLFGRAGRELLPVLQDGSEGLAKLLEGFKQYGLAITEEDIGKTKQFEGANADLGQAFKAVSLVIARTLLPIFTRIMKFTAGIVSSFVKLAANSHIVQAALVVLGAAASVFAVQMAFAAAPVLLITAAFAALVLLVDDIITLFEGGDSVIGRAIDKIFGKGASTEFVQKAKELYESIKTTVQNIAQDWMPVIADDWKLISGFIGDAYDRAEKLFGILSKIAGVLKYIPLVYATRVFGDVAGGKIGDTLADQHQARADADYDKLHPHVAVGAGVLASSQVAAPAYMQPSYPPDYNVAPGSGVLLDSGETTFNIYPSPGMDEKKLADHVADAVDKHAKKRLRDHQSNLARAGQ